MRNLILSYRYEIRVAECYIRSLRYWIAKESIRKLRVSVILRFRLDSRVMAKLVYSDYH